MINTHADALSVSEVKPHWTEKYLGKPWENGARGPFSFDCWGLLWFVYIKELGIRLPLYPGVDAKNYMLTGKMISDATQSSEWRRLDKPEGICAVGMGHKVLTHVGVYLSDDGGMVMHAADGQNVISDSMARLRSNGWGRIEFYKHVKQ